MVSPVAPPSTSYAHSAPGVPLGSTLPRLFTPPLATGPPGPCGCGCALTPATSYGFDAIEFATRVLRQPPRPWQRWATIHGGELLPDGRPRARIVLLLAARQNGKTWLPVNLSLYWQFVEGQALTLGTSTKLDYAKESWLKSVRLAERTPELAPLRGKRWKREANGEQESWTTEDCRYKISASNEEGGRSLTVNRGILDELRQHHSYTAWGAIEPAASPWDAQLWAMSNAGDDRSVVLNDLRESALEYIQTGQGDPRTLLMEWSTDPDADPTDPDALCQANPSVGYGLDLDVLVNAARAAVRLGGEALTTFKTERMCVRVKLSNPAIDPGAWARCLDVGDLAAARSRVACCVDLAPDGQHASLVAAAVLPDGRVRIEAVQAWAGPTAVDELRRDLPALLSRVRPQVLGWLPAGPAAAVAADLADRRKSGRRGWPPPGVTVAEIRGETSAATMGFAEQVAAAQIAHSGDPLLDDHVGAAEKLRRGDAWVFSRRGKGHVDAVYAAAGAVHLARTLPPPVGKPRLVTAS